LQKEKGYGFVTAQQEQKDCDNLSEKTVSIASVPAHAANTAMSIRRTLLLAALLMLVGAPFPRAPRDDFTHRFPTATLFTVDTSVFGDLHHQHGNCEVVWQSGVERGIEKEPRLFERLWIFVEWPEVSSRRGSACLRT